MYKDNEQIRAFTRSQLSGNYWNAIVATMIPGIIFAIVNWILGLVIGTSPVTSFAVSLAIAILSGFMVTTMSLNIAKGSRDAGFGDSLSPGDKLGKYALYIVFMQVIGFIVQLPINFLFFGEWIMSESEIEGVAGNLDPTEALSILWGFIGVSLIVAIILFLILIRLSLVTYIVVDQDVTIMEAVNLSFRYTKGNVWRMIGMRFFFIGWYLVGVITCGLGLFYVIPYAEISFTNLYIQIRNEVDGVEEPTPTPSYDDYDVLEETTY